MAEAKQNQTTGRKRSRRMRRLAAIGTAGVLALGAWLALRPEPTLVAQARRMEIPANGEVTANWIDSGRLLVTSAPSIQPTYIPPGMAPSGGKVFVAARATGQCTYLQPFSRLL